MKKAVVLLAQGFEEIEAIVPIDILRRGGVEVTIAGVMGKSVTGAHSINIEADTRLTRVEDFLDYDAVVLPGGMPGSKNLADSWEVNELVIQCFNEGKIVAAICAAPAVVLARLGLLEGRKAVCYPGAEEFAPDSVFGEQPCIRDENLITARGVGYASDFGLAILSALEGEAKAQEIGSATLFIR